MADIILHLKDVYDRAVAQNVGTSTGSPGIPSVSNPVLCPSKSYILSYVNYSDLTVDFEGVTYAANQLVKNLKINPLSTSETIIYDATSSGLGFQTPTYQGTNLITSGTNANKVQAKGGSAYITCEFKYKQKTRTYYNNDPNNYTDSAWSSVISETLEGNTINVDSAGTTIDNGSNAIGTSIITKRLGTTDYSISRNIYREPNTITSYGNLTGVLTCSVADAPAGGKKVKTSDVTYSSTLTQTITYTSTATRNGEITYNVTGSDVNVASAGTTIIGRTLIKSSAFTVTATGEGSKTATASCDLYRVANSLTNVVWPALNFSYSLAPAGAGNSTASISVSGKATCTYTSGNSAQKNVTLASNKTFSGTASTIFTSLNTTNGTWTTISFGTTASSVDGTVVVNGETIEYTNGPITTVTYTLTVDGYSQNLTATANPRKRANRISASGIEPFVFRNYPSGQSYSPLNVGYSDRNTNTTPYFTYPTLVPYIFGTTSIATDKIAPFVQYNRVRLTYPSGSTLDLRYDSLVTEYNEAYDVIESSTYGIPETKVYRMGKVGSSGSGTYNGLTFYQEGALIAKANNATSGFSITTGVKIEITGEDPVTIWNEAVTVNFALTPYAFGNISYIDTDENLPYRGITVPFLDTTATPGRWYIDNFSGSYGNNGVSYKIMRSVSSNTQMMYIWRGSSRQDATIETPTGRNIIDTVALPIQSGTIGYFSYQISQPDGTYIPYDTLELKIP